jgi:hypothetical protein
MKPAHTSLLMGACLLMASSAVLLGESVSPFPVGDRAQLFVDQLLVRSADNVTFTLHPAQKHPQNPLVKVDKPWEGWRLEIYGSVIYDEDDKLFKMWYIGEEPQLYPYYATFYATSRDGITWEKPLVGTVPDSKGNQTNAVIDQCVLASVIKDKDDPDPARRYKAIVWLQRTPGYYTMISPDGLNWTQLSPAPICRGGDVITGYYDKRLRRYVAFPKIGATFRGLGRRSFWLITSEDFETWTEPRLVFHPDLRDDAGSLARIEQVRPILDVPDNPDLMRTEFYGIGVYQAESCTIAFPWVFTINNNGRWGNQEGPFELQLAVSRDLETWERPFRIPCVPRGKLGEWDCGIQETAAEAIRVGDEIWLYYGGANYTHGTPCLYEATGTGRLTEFTGSIGLATWKLDRFVSVDAGSAGGTLTTVPIVFEGNRLELNAATHRNGSITVEVLDAAGNLLARSEPFTGDMLRGKVTWRDGFRISRLAGKPVMLRFSMKSAELYTFAFRRGR